MNEHFFTVLKKDEGMRIDKYLSTKNLNLSRSAAAKLIDDEKVLVNNKIILKRYIVQEKDEIEISIPKPYVPKPENIDLNIVYEDDYIIIVNKPKGMVVHPAHGHRKGTLVNALLFHCNKGELASKAGRVRPGIVHRIDKDTSGLLVIAKDNASYKDLVNQIKTRTIKREYVALVRGKLKNSKGIIDAPIGRHSTQRTTMTVTNKNSKPGITKYKVIDEFIDYSLVRCKLETGRTHQIRVHMAYIGNPIAGDYIYAKPAINKEKVLKGQCLHAEKLSLVHPKTKKRVSFTTGVPEYFKEFINSITKDK